MVDNQLEQGDILSYIRVRLATIAYLDILLCSIWAMHKIRQTPIFYLMSRGLSRQEAQRMIVQGFFETVITEFPVEGVQEKIRLAIESRI